MLEHRSSRFFSLTGLLVVAALTSAPSCDGQPVGADEQPPASADAPAPEGPAPDATAEQTADPAESTDPAESADPAETADPADAPAPYVDEIGPPPSAAPIAELLAARHAGDLPSREALDAHPDAQAALAWLAGNAEALITRARALEALALYPSDNSREVLLTVATGTGHSKLRSAAARALGTWDLNADVGLRDALVGLLSDPEVPVAVASAKSLAGVAAARPALEAVVAAEGTPSAVLQAAEAALAP